MADNRFKCVVLCLFMLAGCGITAGRGTVNDLAPTLPVLAQGSFQSLSGKSVTGSTTIYNAGGGSYIVRLEGISVTQDSGLQVIPMLNTGAAAATLSLRAFTGNQNYTFTPAITPSGFASVRIYSPASIIDYGKANLTVVP